MLARAGREVLRSTTLRHDGVLLLVALLLLSPAVFLGEALFDRDIHLLWHTQRTALLNAIRAGSWPVWEPLTGFGVPLLANPNAQVFYPTTWLGLPLSPWTHYTAYTLLHLFWAGAGARRLARDLGLGTGAALLAGALYQASGPLVSFVPYWNHFGGAAWMPWVWLATRRALRAPGFGSVPAWAVALAAQVLAGSPDMVLMTGGLVVLEVLRGIELRPLVGPANGRRLVAALSALGLALALSAAQWAPTLAITVGSGRAALAPVNQAVWSVEPVALAQLVLPVRFDDVPLRLPQRAWKLAPVWEPFLRSLYLGLPALALALAGLAFTGARGRVLAALCAGCVMLSLGPLTPLHGLAVAAFPPLGMLRYPAKFLAPAALLWALLAASGAGALLGRGKRAVRFIRAWLLAASALGVLALVGGLGAARAGPVLGAGLAASREALQTSMLLTLLCVLGLTALRSPGASSRVPALVAAVAVADLLAAHLGLNATAPPDLYARRPAVLRLLADTPSPRVFVWDYALRIPGRPLPTDPLHRAFVQVPGRWPALRERAAALREYLFPPSEALWGIAGSFDRDLLELYPEPLANAVVMLRLAAGTPAFERLLRIGGVTHVIALHEAGHEGLRPAGRVDTLLPRPILLFKLTDPLPREYLVGASRSAAPDLALATAMEPSFPIDRAVVLSPGPPPDAPEWAATAPFRGAVEVLDRRPDRLRLRTDASSEAVLVVLAAWDAGWGASLDGAPVPVLPANGIFQGIRVPAGVHEVALRYRPVGLRPGLAIAAAAWLACGVFAWRRLAGGGA
jgi:hypothetical protein